MAFTDELTIHAQAGTGGDGVVRWLHTKGKEFGGPAGGDGGKGGDVYVHAVRDVYLLARYKNKKKFAAEDGGDGGSRNLHGTDGRDLDIQVPIGSVITNRATGEQVSLTEPGERIRLLAGGRGGRGNLSYKSSINRSPQESTPGKPGMKADFFIEIELIADIGLIGLPNAGKTSLLNALTNAKGKIGNYPFTTLEPNLGEMQGLIISDIPGLIEGAGSGKGLGHTFLRHVRRTAVLVHLISLENEDLSASYTTVRRELEAFDPLLITKPELVILTKTDLLIGKESQPDSEQTEKRIAAIHRVVPVAATISIHDEASVALLHDLLMETVRAT